MELIDSVGIGFRLLAHREEVEEIKRLSEPAFREIAKALPHVAPLVRNLIAEVLPDIKLDLGDVRSSFDVKAVQRALNALGGGEKLLVDGVLGKNTRDAISRFQVKCGLQPNGWPGTRTMMALGAKTGSW